MNPEGWRPHVERALAYIAARLGEPLRLRDVAREARLSEFHFHRIFRAVMGEPVGQFITRRRLESGALMLAYHPQVSVTEIALRCGYSSVSNFSKAFSAWFGVSPRGVRAPGAAAMGTGRLSQLTGRAFDPRALYALPPETDGARVRVALSALEAKLRIEDRPALELACCASPAGYELASVLQTWSRLLRHAEALGVGPVDAWGLAFDSPNLGKPDRCRYHACFPWPRAEPIPDALFRGAIPAGRWAVFAYDGPVAGVEDFYRDIYSIWAPRSGLELDDFVAVEHHTHGEPREGRARYDVRLKLRPP